jgi:putative membrane protein
MFAEGGSFMGGMHFLWWIFWLLVVGGIVFYVWGRPGQERQRESAHELLQRRLASGDITAEEYEKRKALLDRDAPSKT